MSETDRAFRRAMDDKVAAAKATAATLQAATDLLSWQQRLMQAQCAQMIRTLRREAPQYWTAQDAFGLVSVDGTIEAGEAGALLSGLTADAAEHLLAYGCEFGFEVVEALADNPAEGRTLGVFLRGGVVTA